jgi:hypothetical protein
MAENNPFKLGDVVMFMNQERYAHNVPTWGIVVSGGKTHIMVVEGNRWWQSDGGPKVPTPAAIVARQEECGFNPTNKPSLKMGWAVNRPRGSRRLLSEIQPFDLKRFEAAIIIWRDLSMMVSERDKAVERVQDEYEPKITNIRDSLRDSLGMAQPVPQEGA